MSGLPVLKTKRRPVYWGLAVVLFSAVLSAGAGLYLARKLRQPLNAVVGALRGIREGDYNVGLQPNQPGELGELQDAIVEMAKALSNARQELEDQVALRTRELQAAIVSANVAGEEKQRLIAQGNILVEEERRRIAVEIHDHLNASLVFVQLESQRIASLARKLQGDDVGRAIEEVAKRISGIAADLYTAARSIVKQLRPEVIDTLGLRGAVQEMVRSYDAAHPDCSFSLSVDPAFPSLPPPLTIAAYRVIQEALSNVVKHARATQARVTLVLHAQGDMCCVTIADNGVGFDTEKRMSTGIGLIGMRERVGAVGGTIGVTSAPGGGTKVTIELPRRQQ